jgi:hypothetical protein
MPEGSRNNQNFCYLETIRNSSRNPKLIFMNKSSFQTILSGLILFLVTGFLVVAFADNPLNLEQFQRKNRLLFFLNDSGLATIQEEISNFSEEIRDRDIRVIYFMEKGGVMLGDSIISDSHSGEWY